MYLEPSFKGGSELSLHLWLISFLESNSSLIQIRDGLNYLYIPWKKKKTFSPNSCCSIHTHFISKIEIKVRASLIMVWSNGVTQNEVDGADTTKYLWRRKRWELLDKVLYWCPLGPFAWFTCKVKGYFKRREKKRGCLLFFF